MKASELRIGNLVLKHNGEITKVSGQFIADFEKYGNETLMTIPPRPFYTGIPLTSEWLEKFGFKQSAVHEYGCRYRKEAVNRILSVEIQYLSGQYDLELYFFDVPLQHVHTLQNLYFALTGEELEVI